MREPLVIVIVGPTASGKTALSIRLAKALGGEVISADSRQVYRGLDIGTGKVTKREMRGIPHHLLDVASPARTFTVDDYVRKGRAALAAIIARGNVPIIVGGTGFYIDALLGRIFVPPVPPHRALRARLSRLSAGELYELLRRKDPRRARTIDRKNAVRLIRALEIAEALGEVPPPAPTPLPYRTLWFGIAPEANVLREKIHARLLSRMRQGMLAEAKRLHEAGLSYARMEALGLEYRSLARHMKGGLSKDEMQRELETKIVQYAKRQMTYFKRNKNIHWLRSGEELTIVREAETET